MVFSKLTTRTSGNGGQYSSRGGRKIDKIILHHCASTSLEGVLNMMRTGSRTVSSNYVIGNGGEIVGVVPEELRAWTSASANWDGRGVTFEIVNSQAGGSWPISAKAFDAVARVMADLSVRYGITLNRTNVITHQELYTRYGASYATACPGPYLQTRIDQLIARAKQYIGGIKPKPTPTPIVEKEDDDGMYRPTVHIRTQGPFEATRAHPEIGTDLKPGQSRKDGNVVVFRGYEVTTNRNVAIAWARTHTGGAGKETSRTNRAGYIAIQKEAQRISVEIAR